MKKYSKEQILEKVKLIFNENEFLTLSQFVELLFENSNLDFEEEKIKNLFFSVQKVSKSLSEISSSNLKNINANSPNFLELENLFKNLFESMNIKSSEIIGSDYEEDFDEDEDTETNIN